MFGMNIKTATFGSLNLISLIINTMNIRIFLTVCLAALSVLSNAQCTENAYKKPFSSRIITYELDSLNGSFEIVLEIEANENTNYKDSVHLTTSPYMTNVPPSNPPGGTNEVIMDSGDVITRTYEFSYDTLDLPFYPKEILILSLAKNSQNIF